MKTTIQMRYLSLFALLFTLACNSNDDSVLVYNIEKGFNLMALPSMEDNKATFIIETAGNDCFDGNIKYDVSGTNISLSLADVLKTENTINCRSFKTFDIPLDQARNYSIEVLLDETVIDTSTLSITETKSTFSNRETKIINLNSIDFTPLPKNLVFGRISYTNTALKDSVTSIVNTSLEKIEPVNQNYGYFQVENEEIKLNFGSRRNVNQATFAGYIGGEASRDSLVQVLQSFDAEVVDIEIYGKGLSF